MTSTTSPSFPSFRRFFPSGLYAGCALALSTSAFGATSLQLGLSAATSDNESNRQVILQWNAEASRTYLVQSTTNLSSDDVWVTVEPVSASAAGTVRWLANPGSSEDHKFYRLQLPQPTADSAQPAFNDSTDPGARLYITGQMLPTNGYVRINGQNVAIVDADPNGSWVAISLNGLPPGVPWIEVVVLDGASNTVATLPIQSPLSFSPAMSVEQVEGPPEDDPPASPIAKKEFKGHVTLLKAYDDGDEGEAAARHTKTGHVTLMKAFDDDGGGDLMAGRFTKSGHVTLLKAFDDDPPEMGRKKSTITKEFKGHVTLLKREMGGGGTPDVDDGDNPLSPVAMKAKEKANRTKCSNNLRINPPTGELMSEETDLAIPGRGLDFAWVRTYRSRAGTNTAQGGGWDFSYNVTLSRQPDGTAQLCTGNGRCDTFYPDGTNGWFRDEYFVTIADLDKDGIPDIVTFADTGRWIFRPQVGGDASSGKLAQIIDRNDNTIRCEYDTLSGRLLRVVDTLDRTNTIAYTGGGQIASVTDFSGRVVRYEYDGNGDLVACVTPAITGTPTGNDFPGGKTNRYSYSSGFADARLNHNLLTCTDGKGQTWLQVTYQTNQSPTSFDFDAVASVVAGSDRTDLWRGRITPAPSNSYTFSRCILRDPVGNVTECFYDSRHRCVKLQEFTGRANPSLPTTPTLNRPTGKLRPGDPDYFETQFAWNLDSMCRAILDPEGTSTEMLYQRAYNQNNARSNHAKAAMHGGDLRLLRKKAQQGVDADGDGITDDLVQTFEYDPRFGSSGGGGGGGGWIIVPAVSGVAINQKGTGADRNRVAGGGLGGRPVGNGVAIKTKGTGADKNRTLPGLPVPNGVAINTKGTGADKGRTMPGLPLGNGVAINTKGTGADRNRTAGGHGFPTVCTDPRGQSTVVTYDSHGNGTRVTWNVDSIPPTIDLSYNSHGQVSSITNAADANGYRRVDTMGYYASGPQAGYCSTFTVDTAGPVITITAFEYDSRGNLTKLTDPLGRTTQFHNNQLNQCVRVETPTNIVSTTATDYIYDANDNLVQCTTELRDENDVFRRGFVSVIDHGIMDRVVTAAEQVSTNEFATNRFVYDGNGRVIQCDSPLAVSGADPNAVVRYDYDERGLLFRSVAAPGTGLAGTNQYDYDGNGNLRITKIDSFTVKQRVYDGFDRPITATDAMGNVATYAYNRNGDLVYERFDGELHDVAGSAGNVRLSEMRYDYDGLDRLTRRHMSFFDPATGIATGDGDSAQSFTYAPNGACASSTDDNAYVTRFAYDTQGRLSIVTDPKTNTVTCAYDAAGNVISVTQSDRSDLTPGAQQFTVAYTYDNLERMVRSVDNVGNTNRYFYDSRDNLVLQSDPRGNDTTCVYDDLSRCVDTIAWNGSSGGGVTISTSHTEYDVNSRCTASTDSNTNKTTYVYDSLGRCISVVEADKTSCSLIWSPRSNLILYGDARGTVISNSFDALDRCVRRDITPGGGVASTTTVETFGYDSCSRCVGATNDSSSSTFAFDSLGNCVASTLNGLTTTSTYDGMGNCVSMTYPSGRIVTRTYNALNDVATVSSSAGLGLPSTQLATYSYEGPGRLGRITRANNINTRLQYDGLTNPGNSPGDFGWGQVTTINHQAAGGGAIIDRRTAGYDRSQNRILRAQTAPFFISGPMTTNGMVYDALDRLTQFTRSRSLPDDLFRSYLLDGNGNRLLGISNGVAGPYVMDATQPSPADYQMNQYTLTPFVVAPQQYDADGNLVSRNTATAQLVYAWDYADRLVSVTDFSGGFANQIAAYAYDALGRRVTKQLYPGQINTALINYAYGGDCDDTDDPILEMRVNGSFAQAFVLDGTRSQDDELLCTFNNVGQAAYHMCDELGNVLALTDGSGNVIERYEYDDYGLPAFLTMDGTPISTNASPAGNPFLFHGQEWDPETEFYGIGMSKKIRSWINDDPKVGRSVRGKVKDIRNTGATFTGYADENPWSLKQEEGGRHTPFHNKAAMGIISKEDVYVWKIKSKEDVYVWKARSKEDVYVWKIKSKEDVYVWKDGSSTRKKALVIPASTLTPGGAYAASKHTKTGHVTLLK